MKLNECPHCGGSDIETYMDVNKYTEGAPTQQYATVCLDCFATTWGATQVDSQENWNRRYTE